MRISRLHRDSVDSTMDTAREEAQNFDFLLVTADQQIQGRGTRGRVWQSPRQNLHMTVAVRRSLLLDSRMDLLPLEAGLKLWDSVAALLPPSNRSGLSLKWPNDLLWQGKKTAGMLMEVAGDFLYIGAGVNVGQSPEILDGGTPSGCLVEAGAHPDCKVAIAESFFTRWVEDLQIKEESLLRQWKEKAVWNSKFRMRDRDGNPQVQPLDVNAKGHLLVRFADGREEWLVADYLI